MSIPICPLPRPSWPWFLVAFGIIGLPACDADDDSRSNPSSTGGAAQGGAFGAGGAAGNPEGDAGGVTTDGGAGGMTTTGGAGGLATGGDSSNPEGGAGGTQGGSHDGATQGGISMGGVSSQGGAAGSDREEGGSGPSASGGAPNGGDGTAGANTGASSNAGTDAGGQGTGGAGGGTSPPKTHAELCPNSSPGAGVPEPVAGATPARLDPFSEYLASPIATPADFGLGNVQQAELIENQPDTQVVSFPTEDLGALDFTPDFSQSWPAWLGYSFDQGQHQITLRPGALKRGSYHITLPLYRDGQIGPVRTTERRSLDLVVRVSGIGFTTDRLVVPHYVTDGVGRPLAITLAGRDAAWRITDAPSWLRIARDAGDSLTSLTLELTRAPELEALGVGPHEGRLCVENAHGDATSVPVYALIERPSLRPLHTQRYLYNFASSEQLRSFTYVFTDLHEQVTWSATSSQPWLKLDRSTGSTNQRLDFSVEPAGLAEGRHQAELTFSDPSGRNDGTRVIVYYLKEPTRLSSWRHSGSHYHYPVSPVDPRILNVSGDTVSAVDVFSDEAISVSEPAAFLSTAISEHTNQLYVISLWDDGTRRLSTYSWPGLEMMGQVETDSALPLLTGRVVSALGHEYVDASTRIVNVSDGRSGPALRPSAPDHSDRLRVYDDGRVLFGFYEDLGTPLPRGYRHWAHSASAVCSSDPDHALACTDANGPYLTIPALPPDFRTSHAPYFTQQGGVYFDDIYTSQPDYAFSASGVRIPLLNRFPLAYGQAQFGDTIIVDEFGANAINYIFEPAPPPADLGEIEQTASTCPEAPGTIITALGVNARTLVADPARDRLYVFVGDSAVYPHELVTLSGSTGAVLDHVALGGTPVVADINADASRLWVALTAPDRLISVDITGARARPLLDNLLPLPTTEYAVQRYATSLAVGSGTLDTVAVALTTSSLNDSLVLLYRGGVLRDVLSEAHRALESGPFGQIFGSEYQYGKTSLLRVEDRHLNRVADVTDKASALRYQDGYLLVQTGEALQLLDVSNPARSALLGTLPFASTMLLDVPNRRIWSIHNDQDGQGGELIVNDLDTLAVTNTAALSFNPTYPRDFVRTRSGCFAVVTSSFDATNVVVFSPEG